MYIYICVYAFPELFPHLGYYRVLSRVPCTVGLC